MAVDAGDKVTVKLSPSKYFHRETAIVINRTTMAKVSSGYLRTSYAPRHASGTSKVGVRRQSLMLAEEKASGFRLALASVHLATKSALRTHDLSQSYRNQWAKQVTTALRQRYPAAANAVTVGGDFNQDMCEYTIEKDRRPWAPFSKTYVDGLDLKDSVRNVIGGHGVDFVFTEAAWLTRVRTPPTCGRTFRTIPPGTTRTTHSAGPSSVSRSFRASLPQLRSSVSLPARPHPRTCGGR